MFQKFLECVENKINVMSISAYKKEIMLDDLQGSRDWESSQIKLPN